ncbi:Vitamin K epoxide reductase [Xylanimonas cellulosilytica DSM 15894]|uniref:Vitamin K epoxide reductase n=1 Tax=Xylanimonas cellulosilytica (strain DSM 15894 / JCM 12276 / CECT 5975 / KCTC 9989 / LMG 20990 / NBRC 107835 / XIL07) TaxID=446471 RepID=D1BY93_XYLCX|nr:vitamin K epoxide reductase family protein [Xylanimonas cellulosilytica]ACZ29936.1 Vitamin K epoxide reductase [Xylanimonas cellulosilytica DSM 15894]
MTSARVPDGTDLVDERPQGFFHSRRWLFGEMLVGALISLVAAFVLSSEAVTLAANPDATFACDLGTVFSCSQVALSWQASLFGFPNAFLGIAAEPVVITIAVLGLSGMRFPRWFMISAQTMYLFGFVFAYWLFFEAVFTIGALCVWCLTVQLATTVVFFSMLHLNILDDNLRWPPRVQRVAMSVVRSGGLGYLLAAWLIATIAVVLLKYGAALLG